MLSSNVQVFANSPLPKGEGLFEYFIVHEAGEALQVFLRSLGVILRTKGSISVHTMLAAILRKRRFRHAANHLA
jgi:hypothetical protein